MIKMDNLQIENKVLQIKLLVSMNICKREHIQTCHKYNLQKYFLDMLKDGERSPS
jgi:hypothetical protein